MFIEDLKASLNILIEIDSAIQSTYWETHVSDMIINKFKEVSHAFPENFIINSNEKYKLYLINGKVILGSLSYKKINNSTIGVDIIIGDSLTDFTKSMEHYANDIKCIEFNISNLVKTTIFSKSGDLYTNKGIERDSKLTKIN